MKSRVVTFAAPRQIEIRAEEIRDPGPGEVRVETEVSAISAGTELLLYRGQIPPGTILDEALPALSGCARFPVAYGYSAVGRVAALGADVAENLLRRRVFAFETHRSSFIARPESLFLVPEGFETESTAFLPTVETAVGLIQDARPVLGERVLVVGQGVVGLVTTALLSRFPLARLVTVDRWERRRRVSVSFGAARAFAPEEIDEGDFDLVFEVSGSPDALDVALAATGVEGRIVVGSWYGDKRADVNLGTRFHRRRLTLRSSQVSRISPDLLARWTKERRMNVALDALSGLPIRSLVSHRFPIESASEAYRLLDESPAECLQVLLTYD
jgi:2-desacetyl-2-hydroxyethyl bacteriochlorophyllide A dehydrogenase